MAVKKKKNTVSSITNIAGVVSKNAASAAASSPVGKTVSKSATTPKKTVKKSSGSNALKIIGSGTPTTGTAATQKVQSWMEKAQSLYTAQNSDAKYTRDYFTSAVGSEMDDLFKVDKKTATPMQAAKNIDIMLKLQAGINYRAGRGEEPDYAPGDALFGLNDTANNELFKREVDTWMERVYAGKDGKEIQEVLDYWQNSMAEDTDNSDHKKRLSELYDTLNDYGIKNYSVLANQQVKDLQGQVDAKQKRIDSITGQVSDADAARKALNMAYSGADLVSLVENDDNLRRIVGYDYMRNAGMQDPDQLYDAIYGTLERRANYKAEDYSKILDELNSYQTQLKEAGENRANLMTAEKYARMLGQDWVTSASKRFDAPDYQYREDVVMQTDQGYVAPYRLNKATLDQIVENPDAVIAQLDLYQNGAAVNDGTRNIADLAKQMKPEEIELYKAISYHDGEEAAQAYFDHLTPELNKRVSTQIAQDTAAFTDEHKILGSVYSFGWNTLGAIGSAAAAARRSEDPYDPSLQFKVMTDTARETVSEDIDSEVLRWLYDVGMSTGDTLTTQLFGGPFGSAIMGMGAMGNTYQDALQRTGNADAALVEGLAVGMLEWMTEKISWGKLGQTGDLTSALSKAKYIGKNIVTETAEEGISAVGGDLLQILIEGQQSEILSRLKYYKDNGYSESEAMSKVAMEQTKAFLLDAAAGGLTGGVLSGGNVALNSAGQNLENRSIGKKIIDSKNAARIIEMGLQSEDTSVQRISEKLLDKLSSGEPDAKPTETAAEMQYVAEAVANENQNGKVSKRKQEKEALEKARQEKVERAKAGELKGDYKGSRAKLGKLYKKVLGALDVKVDESAQKVRENLKQRLTDLGDMQIDEVIDAVVAVAKGESVTSEQFDLVQAASERNGVINDVIQGYDKSGLAEARERAMLFRQATQREITDEDIKAVEKAGSELNEAVAQKENKPVVQVSETGETSYTTEEGEVIAAKVESFATNDSGELVAVMDGAQVPVDHVQAADDAESTLLARAAGLKDAEAATAMYEDYDNTQDVDSYTRGFEAVYNNAMIGRPELKVRQLKLASGLTDAQFTDAYRLGSEYAAARQPRPALKTGGKVTFAGDLKQRMAGLDANQKSAVNALKRFAEIGGVNIEFFESTADEKGSYKKFANGSYNPATNTISIDIHAGKDSTDDIASYALLRVAGHELTHYIKAQNTEGYTALQEFVFDELAKRDETTLDELIAAKMEQQPDLSYADAAEEVVADGCEMMLRDSTVAQRLAETNRGLFNRIRSWLRNFAQSVRRAFQGVSAHSDEAKLLEKVEGLQKVWDDALVKAIENVRGVQHKPKGVSAAPSTASNTTAYTAEAHIDQRTDDSIAEQEPFFNDFDDLRDIYAYNTAVSLWGDVTNSEAAQKVFVWESGTSQPDVLGQKRTTTELIAKYKDKYKWTWDQMGKLLTMFTTSIEEGKPIPNTANMKRLELMIDDALTNGYTDIAGIKVAPAKDYIIGKAGIEGSLQNGMKNTEGTPDGVEWGEYVTGIPESAIASETADAKYSPRVSGSKYDYTKPFAEQVDDWLNNKIPERDTLLVGGMPKVLQNIGFAKVPLVFDQKHMRMILGNPKNADHDLGKEFMKRLPDYIENPVAIIENADHPEDGVIMIVAGENTNTNGNRIVGYINVNEGGQINGISIDAIRLKTVHSRSDAITKLENAIKKEESGNVGVYYWNKKEAFTYIEPGQAQGLGRSLKDGFIHSINENGSPVKPRIKIQTDTSQFRRWFKGSVVKNPDGTPKVMYHGTSRYGFSIFDTYNSRYGLMGMGSYFTDNREVAEGYTAKGKGSTPGVYSVYLSIKNPIDMDAVAGNSLAQKWRDYFDDYLAPDDKITGDMTNEQILRVIEGALRYEDVTMSEAAEMFTGFYESNGFDGITHIGGKRYGGKDGPNHRVYIAFEPTQIKSATDNIGAFDPDHPNIYYSTRTDNLTDRDILAAAFENVAQNDNERDFLKRYKGKIKDLYDLQSQLTSVRKDIKDLMFTAGKRPPDYKARLAELNGKANTLAEAINRVDKRLLGFESAKPLRDVLARERAKVEKEGAAKRKAMREARAETELRHRIRNLADDFNRRLKSPTERRYIPSNMVQLIVKVQELVDTRSGRERDQEKASEKLAEIHRMYARYKEDSMYSFVHDETIDKMLLNLANKTAGKNIYQLNKEDLKMVYETMKGLRKQVTDAAKLKSKAYNADMFETGKQMFRDTQEAAPLLRGVAGDYINWQLTPDKFFSRLAGHKKGSAWMEVAKSFSDGTQKMLEIQRDAYYHFRKWTESKEFDKLGSLKDSDLIDIGLKDASGKPVKVTRGMMLEVYMHLQNEDNITGFMYGGFSVPQMKKYYAGKVAESYGTGSINTVGTSVELAELAEKLRDPDLTDEQRAEIEQQMEEAEARGMDSINRMRQTIESKLTAWDRGLIEAVHEWNDVKSRNYINDVTMDMYDIKRAQVENYYPIRRDTAFVNTDFESISRNMNLENWGALKERVKSRAPILLGDIAFTVDNSVKQTSKYVGYVRAQRDFNKLYNVRLPDTAGGSVKKIVATKFGTGERSGGASGTQYIENYIGSITGSRKSESDFLTVIRRNLPRATMSLNFRVGFSQISALPKAAVEVGWKNLAEGMANGGAKAIFSKKAREELARKNAWFWQRYQGEGGQREFADAKGGRGTIDRTWNWLDDKTGGWLLNLNQKVDVATTAAMWSSAEAWVRNNRRDLRKGSEAFENAVNEKYTDILRNTQAANTVSERSDLARGSGGINSILTMYKSEAFANFNILYDSVARLKKYADDLKDGKNGVTKADVSKARWQLANSITSVVIASSVLNAVIKLGVNAIFSNMSGYRDNEDEITAASIAGSIGKEMLNDAAGMVAVGSIVYDAVAAVVFDETYYGPSYAALDDFTTATKATINYLNDEDKTVEDFAKAAEKVGKSAFNMLGIPANNAKRQVEGLVNTIRDIAAGRPFSFEASAQRSNSTNYSRMLSASLKGNEKKYTQVFAELMAGGMEENDIYSGYRGALKDAYQDGDVSREQALELLVSYGGKTEDEAYWLADEWDYEGDGNYSKYGDIRTALAAGNQTEAEAAIAELIEHGTKAESIASEMSKVYNNGESTTILTLQLRPGGLYTPSKPKGSEDDFDAYFEALLSGRDTREEVKRLRSLGYTTNNIMTALNNAFGNKQNYRFARMVSYNPTEAAILEERILDAYVVLGLNREKERVWIHENWTMPEEE